MEKDFSRLNIRGTFVDMEKFETLIWVGVGQIRTISSKLLYFWGSITDKQT